jgi:hypothetical protein
LLIGRKCIESEGRREEEGGVLGKREVGQDKTEGEGHSQQRIEGEATWAMEGVRWLGLGPLPIVHNPTSNPNYPFLFAVFYREPGNVSPAFPIISLRHVMLRIGLTI